MVDDPDNFDPELGGRLKYAFAQAGVSAEAAAEACGVSVQAVYKWFRTGQIARARWPVFRKQFGLDIEALLVPRHGGVREQNPEYGEIVPLAPGGGQLVIPLMDVTASMGHGAMPPDHVEVLRTVAADVSQLRRICSFTAPMNLQLITGYGESMKPTFSDGDTLLVDVGITDVKIDAVYVFTFEDELFIKRIQRMPGGTLRVISDNRDAFDAWDVAPHQLDTFSVKARVVLAWNARRL